MEYMSLSFYSIHIRRKLKVCILCIEPTIKLGFWPKIFSFSLKFPGMVLLCHRMLVGGILRSVAMLFTTVWDSSIENPYILICFSAKQRFERQKLILFSQVATTSEMNQQVLHIIILMRIRNAFARPKVSLVGWVWNLVN